MAITSFDVMFDSSIPGTSTSSSGVKGKMTFNFTQNSGNEYTLDLDISNTSPVVDNPSGTLVGFAFNVPGKNNTPSDIKLLTYNPLNSNFGDVYGATANGSEANVANNTVLSIASNAQPAPLNPYGSFTFCARETGSNCGGGPANGLADGQSTKVRFTLASNLASVDTAEEVTQSFYNLFNSWNPATNPSSPQVALRFQNVTTSGGQSDESEKVGGLPKDDKTSATGVPPPT